MLPEDKSRTVVMDKDKGEPVISVKTEEKKEAEKKTEREKVEDKDKKPEGETTEGEGAATTTEEGTKTEGRCYFIIYVHVSSLAGVGMPYACSLDFNPYVWLINYCRLGHENITIKGHSPSSTGPRRTFVIY